jgi:hypothetical protein
VFLFRAGVVQRHRLTDAVKRAYRAPHASWSSRTPILVFPREIPSGPEGSVSDLAAEIEAGLERNFHSKPVAIAWGMKRHRVHARRPGTGVAGDLSPRERDPARGRGALPPRGRARADRAGAARAA